MELGGQVILWASDASFEHSKLVERYGSYLKSDILQVPHHGFGCGSASEQIKGFEFIKPSVCLLPVSDYNAYTMFCTYIEGTSYLMQMPCVKEMITGETQRTITLPYSAPPIAKVELDRKFTEGRADGGSRTWVYSDLSTACTEDFEFTVLNMTNKKASLSIDIFFETSDKAIRYIKATVDQNTIKHLSIVGDDVDGDALYFNWMSLKEKGIPENAPFAVRFMSNVPVVVSHKKHKAAYYSSKI